MKLENSPDKKGLEPPKRKVKMKKFLFLSFLVLLLVACSVYHPKIYTPRNVFAVDASFDKTWSSVVETCAEMNIPVKQMQKDSGFIEVELRGIAYGWADFGEIPSSLFHVGRLEYPTAHFNIYVKSISDNQSEIRMDSDFIAIIIYNVDVVIETQKGVSTGTMDVAETRKGVSTGRMEDFFYQSIMKKIHPAEKTEQ